MEVLKVSSKSNPNSVAGALAGIIREQGAAEIQTVGAGASTRPSRRSPSHAVSSRLGWSSLRPRLRRHRDQRRGAHRDPAAGRAARHASLMVRVKADLHVHTTASDGTLTRPSSSPSRSARPRGSRDHRPRLGRRHGGGAAAARDTASRSFPPSSSLPRSTASTCTSSATSSIRRRPVCSSSSTDLRRDASARAERSWPRSAGRLRIA